MASIDTLSSIPKLEALWLKDSFVSDLNPLLNLPNLEYVNPWSFSVRSTATVSPSGLFF